ncbi:MAG: Imm1 family immunity protein, partial [Acidocella sp.]|nr:Imm1 family immunity protein [Acidocella sp.]
AVIARFIDRQDSHNPHNGAEVPSLETLVSWLDETRGRPPFFCELLGDNGFRLLVGVSGTVGCAQYSAMSGKPPYLMATDAREIKGENDYVEFLTANTDTPVPKKFCLPMSRIKEVLADFVATGEKGERVTWEAI